MKLKPLGDRVVLKQNAAEERTSSGIFLTASAQEKPEVYEVVEVGPGGMVDGNEVVMIVKPGQSVLVGKYSGSKVNLRMRSTPSSASLTFWPSLSNSFNCERGSQLRTRAYRAQRCAARRAWSARGFALLT